MSASWMEWRRELPVTDRFAYLNTGTAGPIPRCSHAAIRNEAEHELRQGRGNFAKFARVISRRESVRGLVARLLGADAEEIALTHHTSEGVNIVVWGLPWQPGDSLVTTTLEHDAVAVPLALLRDRLGVHVRFADVGCGERALAALEETIDAGTRLVVLSHIVWSTGARLPIRELADLAHRRGALVLVDGAQSAGVLPLDMTEVGADFYTVSGQKWLCGPEGTGALFVRRDRLRDLAPTFASYSSPARHDYRGQVTFHESARRYELAMAYRPTMAGFEASLGWLLNEVSVEGAWERSLALASRCRRETERLVGVEVVSREDLASQLVAFDLPDFSPARLHALTGGMSDRDRVVVRSIDTPPYALRASLGFFNNDDDIAALVDSVREALKRGPSAVEVTGYAGRLPDTREPGPGMR